MLTQEMKRHAVIVAIHAEHSDVEIARFLKVARSFVNKVRKELEASGGDVLSVAKRKKHSQRSDIIRTQQFVQQVQEIIDTNPEMSIRAIARNLNVCEGVIRTVVHDDIRYKSYVMRRGQFMSEQTKEQRLIRGKRLLNKVKHPEEPGLLPGWPPSSPDLNPLDYYVWGVLERETNEHSHNTIHSLKAAITRAMSNINKNHLIRACQRFRKRIEAVIEAKGGYIE